MNVLTKYERNIGIIIKHTKYNNKILLLFSRGGLASLANVSETDLKAIKKICGPLCLNYHALAVKQVCFCLFA
jgi:hypothetical protein